MHPQAESAPLEAEQKFNFFEEIGEIWTVGEYSSSFSVCFESDERQLKRSLTFLVKKSTPDKILTTRMV